MAAQRELSNASRLEARAKLALRNATTKREAAARALDAAHSARDSCEAALKPPRALELARTSDTRAACCARTLRATP